MNIIEIEQPYTEVKLCINCKWFMTSDEWQPKCKASEKRDLVTGEYTYYYCKTEREWETSRGCGPSGKNYEPNIEG
jgi:hypothetical protein